MSLNIFPLTHPHTESYQYYISGCSDESRVISAARLASADVFILVAHSDSACHCSFHGGDHFGNFGRSETARSLIDAYTVASVNADRIAIDITAFSRRDIVSLFTSSFFMSSACEVDIYYSPGQFDDTFKVAESYGTLRLEPLVPSGVLRNRQVTEKVEPKNDLKLCLIAGLGLEIGCASTLFDYFQPDVTLPLVPSGTNRNFIDEIENNSLNILEDSLGREFCHYDLTNPTACLMDLTQFVSAHFTTHRVVIACFGPKIFLLIALLCRRLLIASFESPVPAFLPSIWSGDFPSAAPPHDDVHSSIDPIGIGLSLG
jgi:hypothetical protein